MGELNYKLTSRGFFSELNLLILASIYSAHKKLDFSIDDTDWMGGKLGSIDCFLDIDEHFSRGVSSQINDMFSRNCRFYLQKIGDLSRGRRVLYGPDFMRPIRDSREWSRVLGISLDNVQQVLYEEKKKYLEDKIVLNENLNKEISKRIAKGFVNNIGDYGSIHIRRGDKISTGEMKEIAIVNYFIAMRETNIKSFLIFSDCQDSVLRLQEMASSEFNLKVISTPKLGGHKESDFQGYEADLLRAEICDLLYETEIMCRSSYLICTFSSNVSRYVALRLGLENCRSLDIPWHAY